MARTPRLVTLSLAVYRLLLAAYPAAFRQAYGEAMVQLFRDSAMDGYRQHGTGGLLRVWLRTLVDFAVSVGRQHREEAARPYQFVSLGDLVQRWIALGAALLSVIVLSLYYLVFQRPVRTCVVASLLILTIWVNSFVGKLGIFSLGQHTSLKIYNGVVEFRHLYARGEPISEKRYFSDPKYRNTITRAMPWECSFSSAHWVLSGSSPYQYCLLRFPVPVLFVFVLLFYWRFHRPTRFESAMHSA